ncbi:MAG: hypothetical protein K2L16_08510 [Muribaculaceae bacterium]|nr:hypothetical protein [Muribaculaceae bacterium]
MANTSTLPFPTRRLHHIHSRLQLATATTSADRGGYGPRPSTLARLRQFARAYCPVSAGCDVMTGIVMN